jgi:hypothetical protein
MTKKRTVQQSVFDSPEARRIARQAVTEVKKEALDAWRRGDPVPEGDPNHPKYNGGVDPRKLFGRPVQQHLDLQQRRR